MKPKSTHVERSPVSYVPYSYELLIQRNNLSNTALQTSLWSVFKNITLFAYILLIFLIA